MPVLFLFPLPCALKIEIVNFFQRWLCRFVLLFPDVLFVSLLWPNHSVNFCCNLVMSLASINGALRLLLLS